jgi:hypothetical protein
LGFAQSAVERIALKFFEDSPRFVAIRLNGVTNKRDAEPGRRSIEPQAEAGIRRTPGVDAVNDGLFAILRRGRGFAEEPL